MIRSLVAAAVMLSACKADGPCVVSPGTIDFGEVETGSSGTSQPVLLSNPSARTRVWTFVPPDPPFFLEGFGQFDGQSIVTPPHSNRSLGVRFMPQDGLLHHSDLRFQTSDESCAFEVQLTGLGAGLLRVGSEPTEFTLAPGQSETKELRVENTRRVPVPISISWTFPNQLSVSPSNAEVPALGSIPLVITAHPSDWWPTTSQLQITSEGQLLTSLVQINPPSPAMDVAPLRFDVPVIGAGQFVERTFRVTNTGSSGDPGVLPLAIGASNFSVTQGEAAEMTFDPRQNGRLAEGEAFDFTVTVNARARAGPRLFRFSVRPVADFLKPIELTLTTNVAVLPPCGLEITPLDALQLHEIADGGVEGTVSFRNTAMDSCIVDNVRVLSSTHVISAGGGSQLEVPAGGTHLVTIAGPRAPAGSVGELRFHVMNVGSVDQRIDLRSP